MLTTPVLTFTAISPELADARYTVVPGGSTTIEVGGKGRVMGVPGVLVDVLIGTRLREFVLAA